MNGVVAPTVAAAARAGAPNGRPKLIARTIALRCFIGVFGFKDGLAASSFLQGLESNDRSRQTHRDGAFRRPHKSNGHSRSKIIGGLRLTPSPKAGRAFTERSLLLPPWPQPGDGRVGRGKRLRLEEE